MAGVLKSALAKRASGGRLSPPHAFFVALLVGVVAAVLAYRLMRI